jgi:hypothetical protein
MLNFVAGGMHTNDERDFFITFLFGLFIKCPFLKETGECPFAAIRQIQPLEMRFQTAGKMVANPEAIAMMLEIHNACYSFRLRGRMGHIQPIATPPPTRPAACAGSPVE